jgi:hypothetical protein
MMLIKPEGLAQSEGKAFVAAPALLNITQAARADLIARVDTSLASDGIKSAPPSGGVIAPTKCTGSVRSRFASSVRDPAHRSSPSPFDQACCPIGTCGAFSLQDDACPLPQRRSEAPNSVRGEPEFGAFHVAKLEGRLAGPRCARVLVEWRLVRCQNLCRKHLLGHPGSEGFLDQFGIVR